MSATPDLLDRFSAWALDAGGDIYGVDERERLRWYEGIAVAASAQWLLVPYVLAGAAWFGGRPAAPAVTAVAVAFYLPMAIAQAYAVRHRVGPPATVATVKRVLVAVASAVPMVLLLLALARAYGLDDPFVLVGALIGGLIGLAVALAWSAVRARRQRADASPGEADASP